MKTKSLFQDIPPSLPSELFETLLTGSGHFRVERIVSEGQCSPPGFWYDQYENEWVLLLQGEAHLLIDGDTEPRRLKPGDYLNISAHKKHRVEWTPQDKKTVWLAIYYSGTADQSL